MPRRSRGPRLWLEPEEFGADGKRQRHATWVIKDGSRKKRTGCSQEDRAGAEAALGEYIAEKHGAPSRDRGRHPDQILVLDVLNIYLADVVPGHARPEETKQRILTLGDWWQSYTLADVNGQRCREYTQWRTRQKRKSAKPEVTGRPAQPITQAMARRELEDLRAAINYHRQEGFCAEIVSVALPKKPMGRDVWLTRSEAARLLWAAWRARQVMQDKVTLRPVGKHVARFILIGLYTGTRSGAICGAAYMPTLGRGWLDLERGSSTGDRGAPGRRRSANRPYGCQRGSSLTCGAGSGSPNAMRAAIWHRRHRSNGTASRSPTCARALRQPSRRPDFPSPVSTR